METNITTVGEFFSVYGFQLLILCVIILVYVVTKMVLEHLKKKDLIDDNFKKSIFKSVFKTTDGLVELAKNKDKKSGSVIETIQDNLEETIEPKEEKQKKTRKRKPKKTEEGE